MFVQNYFVMNITNYVLDTINRYPKGYVFTYLDIGVESDKREAVIKSLKVDFINQKKPPLVL